MNFLLFIFYFFIFPCPPKKISSQCFNTAVKPEKERRQWRDGGVGDFRRWMKRKLFRSSSNRIRRRGKDKKNTMKGSLTTHLSVQLGNVSLLPHQQQISASRFNEFVDSQAEKQLPSTSLALDFDTTADVDEKDFILSQDFFWYDFWLYLDIFTVFVLSILFSFCLLFISSPTLILGYLLL